MSPVVLLIIAILLPTAAGFACLGAVRGARRLAESRRTSRARRVPAEEPIERLGARLRRLRTELEATENLRGGGARNHRLRAVRGAYADCLSEACQRLAVNPPRGGERAPLAEVYRAEAALRQRGLDVRQKPRAQPVGRSGSTGSTGSTDRPDRPDRPGSRETAS